jgi:general secretion pathway protein A
MEIPYLKYFGLTEKPFGLTPDPLFYFETETHREALSHLAFLLGQKEGFALIYGDVGLGKTTLSRIFLSSLDSNIYNTALILNPVMDEDEFLRAIIKELDLKVDGSSRKKLYDDLEFFLLEAHKKGKETVIVIDEAQLLSIELLEFIRILSNMETEKEKILRIILFAQPELVEKLKEPSLRHLAQRITVTYKLKPFSERDVRHYIAYRLIKAGSKGIPNFKKGAARLIFKAAHGYPRLINILCDRCMLSIYAKSKNIVDKQVVADVLKEENISLTSVKMGYSSAQRYRIIILSLTGIILILIAIYIVRVLGLK